jgi:hypothetical protein
MLRRRRPSPEALDPSGHQLNGTPKGGVGLRPSPPFANSGGEPLRPLSSDDNPRSVCGAADGSRRRPGPPGVSAARARLVAFGVVSPTRLATQGVARRQGRGGRHPTHHVGHTSGRCDDPVLHRPARSGRLPMGPSVSFHDGRWRDDTYAEGRGTPTYGSRSAKIPPCPKNMNASVRNCRPSGVPAYS